MPNLFSAEEQEEYRGLYWEEVGKLVDGIESEILDGTITTIEQVLDQLQGNVRASTWTDEDNDFAICVLKYSKHPRESLVFRHIPPAAPSGSRRFPFGWFAADAMIGDCADELHGRLAFGSLKERAKNEIRTQHLSGL